MSILGLFVYYTKSMVSINPFMFDEEKHNGK